MSYVLIKNETRGRYVQLMLMLAQAGKYIDNKDEGASFE